MAEFVLTHKAVEDLAEIWNYTFDKWSEQQADRYYHLLLNSCQKIAENPGLGKSYDILVPGLSGFRVSRHIIFYIKSASGSVQIIRILHGKMDLKYHLVK